MLMRVLFWSALALGAVKIFWPGRWRELGERANRVVNAILIAIAVVYTGQLLWWLIKGH
jgi:hypothetical protein